MLEVGKKAPDFTLPSTEGRDISLSDYRGKKVVIYFYPKDMTPGCTTESCNFRDANEQFQGLNAVVLGISADSLKSHEKFISKHQLPFTLLSDEDHKVCELYDVWQPKKMFGKEFMGLVRSSFLIDEDGVLQKEWRKVKVKEHVDEVLETVKNG